ncbi:unnamed protein product [Cylindrotheca closterium]|uniref:Uncharacterized protein n=1 Tax=Cylindrotheca closterium TaxID=2856 RepID=A0AAD2FWK8_9STRA|nr:unnamed protein product [Cylindrotheca closterium]
MASVNQARRQARRSSAVGLLSVDDENIYGDNANKYGKKTKGSFLSRVKQNVGQKLEAAKTKKISMNGGVNMLVSKSGHSYSAEQEADSDEWESEDDFESNDDGFDADQIDDGSNQNSGFDQSFDFPNAFGASDDQPKELDASQHSFFDDNGSEQLVARSSTVNKSSGIKARSQEGSKFRAHRRTKSLDDALQGGVCNEKRKSNDDLLSRRLEDNNLTKIKYGDEASILQFNPMKQQALPPKDEFQSEPFSVASANNEVMEEDPHSKSEQFTLDENGDNSKQDKTKKKIRQNKSTPSDKVMRRAQRRSAGGTSTDEQDVGRIAPDIRNVRRTKSADDTPFDMSEVDEKKSQKKRSSRSTKRNSSSHSKTMNSSSHHSKTINASSHSKTSSRKKKSSASKRASKDLPNSKAEATPTPPEITQPSTLDVRF